jgi:flavin-dependent dehydrogenase
MAAPGSLDFDVVIVGGGPAGSTAASLLRKYNPELRVLVVEREKFPRDHVGESQLPSIGSVLDEMGVWEKVEAANFPIKIGASYTWGRNDDRWEFDFYPVEEFVDEPRPAKFEGQRRLTAFQVDRAIYDKILLDHAASLGAEVREETRVAKVETDGDRIVAVELDGGERITARWFIDASGTVGILRRAVGVEAQVNDDLKNIAIWDYWRNAEWAVEIGVGATRVQVRSLPYGWMWFIPLGPDRTSIGLVTPADHYKTLGLSPEELYLKAVSEQPEVTKLTRNATREMRLESCKDWSQLSSRIAGENWFVAGEAAGFADPILAAGMSLAHSSARDAAYTILELERGEIDAMWLRDRYNHRNRENIAQHIRFGQYWYSANSCFTDLREHCQKIAADAGLKLAPQQAWQWLSQGGFATQEPGIAGFGSFDVFSAKQILRQFDTEGREVAPAAHGYNTFKLNLRGAKEIWLGKLAGGRIERVACYERANRRLPVTGHYGMIIEALKETSDAQRLYEILQGRFAFQSPEERNIGVQRSLQALDAMITDGWVLRSVKKGRPVMRFDQGVTRFIRSAEEVARVVERGTKGTVKSNI